MTLDRTLKAHGTLARQRSVLTRAERIARMIDEGKFDPQADSPLGLPKTKVRHSRAGMKSKKAAEQAPDQAAKEPGAEKAGGGARKE